MNNRELALKIAGILNEKKAQDISVIDISEKSGFADYFVIATAGSLRMLGALADEAVDRLAKEDVIVHHIEGKGASGWILLDFGDIIINLFTEEQRSRYQIERIWNDCPRVEFSPEA